MTGDLIQVVDCLTDEQCKEVISQLNETWWSPTTVFGFSGTEVNTGIRNNDRICLSDDSTTANIMHEAMNQSLLCYRDAMYDISPEFQKYPVPGTYRTNCHREEIQVLRYNKGEYYNWHHDQGSDPNFNARHRTFSVVLYLQNADEGGRTIFPHRAYRPKNGQALIFPSNWCFPHRAEEVARGQKISAVTWYHCHYNYD